MKVIFDTELKTTAFIEAAGTTVVHPTEETVLVKSDGTAVNPATGQALIIVPGFVSELATLLTGKQSVDAGKENPNYSTGDKEGRSRVLLDDSGEYSYPMPTRRTVYEFVRPAGVAAVAVHFSGASGKVRVELAGDPGGAVNGGAALAEDGITIAGTIMEGNLDAYRKEVSVTGRLTANLRLDAGAPTVLLVVTPL